MFKKTLRKLTALNSLVFLLIFITLTSIIYGYLSFRLYDKVDDAMRFQASSVRIENGRVSQPRGRPILDPRIFLILRDEEGHIVNLTPFRTEESSNLIAIASQISTGELQTIEYENHVYRGLIVPYPNDKTSNPKEEFKIKEVVAISIVDSEVGLLNNLLWIIIGGLIAGMLVIVLAGHLLARRAMIPIEAAWEKQQQFVADASHELRSPITGIYSNAELMLRHPERTIAQESYRINNIMKESARMTKLISSLLTLARSDANKADLRLGPINVSDVIQIVIEHFRSLDDLNKINLSTHVEPKLELIADQERIHQLIVILLDNAFKYTTQGGTIFVSACKVDKDIVFSVKDTGCGISTENLPRVFDRFFRGDKARSRDKGGTGLGLAIAKWIVEKHRGEIEVESQLGVGTKFTVSIPINKVSKEN
ncbi:cell wall metabolism sensor histidine kinase WalK [Pelosinus sp. UFO1]|uniref:sensor histidine kinase n=1 Tax=Pelosinus sp. UFO1 TaxID=484770 RepID=UPI0004D0D8AE|nr:HAMP domain-containing sensor histidine kinase [Pelosinus sp. UFO1]AIF52516.1 integral membrane sensor signal transduction histidine kinase [Pelosinus sp. UFO1]